MKYFVGRALLRTARHDDERRRVAHGIPAARTRLLQRNPEISRTEVARNFRLL